MPEFREKDKCGNDKPINFDGTEVPMAAVKIYSSGDESENPTPCSSPNQYLTGNEYDPYDVINELIASQHEQPAILVDTATHCPGLLTFSKATDDDEDGFINTPSGRRQIDSKVPERRPQRIAMCQQLTLVPDTPKSGRQIEVTVTRLSTEHEPTCAC